MPLAFTTQSLPGLSTVELEDIKVGPDTDCLLDDTLSETARLERMMAWLAQGQGKVGHVEFKTYEDEYRGVHAARNVPNNVILLEVPMNYIMTTDLCKASRLGRRIDTSGVKLMTSHTYVAALLVQERFNPTSFWKPYISILPRTFKTMPLHFQDCEIDELEGSLVLPRLEQQRRNLLHEYNNICKHVPAFQLFSLELFTWARLCVLSRIFGFTVKSYKTDGIVPLADMLNHKSVHQTLWNFDTKRNSFTITTLEQINKGDPVFDSYGRKCNSRFLLNYGFALEDNSDNEAAFEVKLEPGEPFFAAKMRLLGSAARKFNLTASCSDFASKECFSFLRIAVAHNEEMLLLAGAFGLDVCNVKPLSLANELRVLAVLRAIAEQALARFPCSIAQDELLLPHAKGNLRNIIIMRLGEKRVYKWFVALHGLVEAVIGGPSLSSNSKGGEIWPALERVAGDVAARDYVSTCVATLLRTKNGRVPILDQLAPFCNPESRLMTTSVVNVVQAPGGATYPFGAESLVSPIPAVDSTASARPNPPVWGSDGNNVESQPRSLSLDSVVVTTGDIDVAGSESHSMSFEHPKIEPNLSELLLETT